VPPWLRPLLPVIKAGAALALVATAGHPRRRSVIASALVSYYSAAVTFHILSDEGPEQAVPAAAFAALAAIIVEPPRGTRPTPRPIRDEASSRGR
jgi:hypothetical protein